MATQKINAVVELPIPVLTVGIFTGNAPALTATGVRPSTETNDGQRHSTILPAAKHGLLVLLGLALILLTACKPEPSSPMRIGMHVWPGFEPLFLARHLGALDEEDFRLVEFSDGSEVGRAFRNGTAEAVCLTLDEAFYLVQNGMDPVILLVMDESHGADAVLGQPGITNLAGLKGKRVAVEVNAVETYMLMRALQHAGLTVKDIKPVYLPPEKHLKAFQSRSVDAVVTYEPIRSRLLALGAAELFNSTQMPGEIVDVLVVRRDYLEKNPGRARVLRQAWFAALEQLRRSPGESAKFMALREQVTPEEFTVLLRSLRFPDEPENRALLEGNPPTLMETAERLKTVMRDAGLLQQDIPLKPLFPRPDALKPTP